MRWFDKIVRLEDIKWLERLVRHGLSVGVIPTLLRRTILSIRETVLVGLTTMIKTTVNILESVRVVLNWSVLYNEVVSVFESVLIDLREIGSLLFTESLRVIETVVTTIYETITRNLTENLNILETVVTYISSSLSASVNEVVNLIETVSYQLQTQSTLQWDYSVAYNQQGNQITLDLSSLQDNNTSTAVNIYYTPPVPSNPRRFVVGWNEARWFMQINIHINGYTTGKQLIVTIRDSFGYTQTAVLNITGTGWYLVYPDFYEIANVKEVEFAPDTSVLGYIGISEVWFVEGF